MRLQRVRDAGNRIEMQASKWTVEGAVKSLWLGESIQQRNTSVKGEECDGTLRESIAQAMKQGGTAGISINSLSLELLKSKHSRTGFFAYQKQAVPIPRRMLPKIRRKTKWLKKQL